MKLKQIFIRIVALLPFTFFLTGCGTVSSVTPVTQVNWQKYQRVIVADFVDGVTTNTKASNQSRKKAEMAVAVKEFPDRIAIELGAKNAFTEVLRNGSSDEHTLIISGTITHYEEGSAAARLWVGMGAGSAYFDATVEFKDGITSSLLATQQVNKNSWQLGGAIAASQTPEGFMKDAAVKLADDISSLKLTGALPVSTKAKSPSGH